MNRVLDQRRQILSAVALGALIGALTLWIAHAQLALASDPPLSGSSKTASPSLIQPGGTVTFTIVLSNSSASDVAATVIDPSPNGMSYIAASPPGSTLILNTNIITWTGNVTANQSVTLTFWAQANASLRGGAVVTNTATISDGINLIERSATMRTVAKVYLPIIVRRWPPIPYTPVLNTISNPSHSGSYTVTWQAADLATWHVLQEDDNNSFSSPEEYNTGTEMSKAFTNKKGGTYYYRVQGRNEWGPGEWSNIESVIVGLFMDDFSDPSSGWRIASDPLYRVGYTNGEYQIYVPLDFRGGGNVDTWFDQPVVLAPFQPPSGSPYCVSVDTYFASEPGWWEVHGLVFGASADLRTIYRLETNVNGDWGVSKFTSYHIPYGGIHAGDIGIIDWHEEDIYRGRTHLKVVVDNKTATFYINGRALDFATGLNDLPSLNRVGVIGGSYEVTPVDSRFDNFMWSADVNACP